MAEVNFIETTCRYRGQDEPAVDRLNLSIADGEFMVLVGPSGSGKSTALRMLAGLEEVTSGEIQIGGRDVRHVHPKDRDIAMVFQNYALYPHMTVADNMGFALKLQGVAKAERAERVQEAARMLNLEQYLERKPKALSGGQRQRVAMGRAIVRHPGTFLMDEPLSNLDAKLRTETRANIRALQRRLGTTTIFVTHDQVEAMTLGDRVAVLKDGALQQVGAPRHLYDYPVNLFVATFVGSPEMNVRTARVTETALHVGDTVIRPDPAIMDAVRKSGLKEVVVGVRSESVTMRSGGGGLTLSVAAVEELGAERHIIGSLGGDADSAKPFIVRHTEGPAVSTGDQINLTINDAEVQVFDPVTGLRIGPAAANESARSPVAAPVASAADHPELA
jgi:multiple sugar transport system ATP-binding protein